jgi:hypothetical protein
MLYDAKLSLSPQINPCPNNNKKVIVSNSKDDDCDLQNIEIMIHVSILLSVGQKRKIIYPNLY